MDSLDTSIDQEEIKTEPSTENVKSNLELRKEAIT